MDADGSTQDLPQGSRLGNDDRSIILGAELFLTTVPQGIPPKDRAPQIWQ